MAFPNSLSALAGATIAGLSSPTYTAALDINTGNEKTLIVTALGGTQTGVSVHTNSNPFSIKVAKARQIKAPPTASNGVLRGGGVNVFRLSLIKGVVPLSGQNPVVSLISTEIRVPAGGDVADVNSIKAALSLFWSFGYDNAQAISDMVLTNTI